jgi:DnaA family protein
VGAGAFRIAMQQLPLGVRLPDRALFESFLPGPNAEALAHARAIAGGEARGPAWLSGPGGAGKTHLLQATCAAASAHMRVGYLPLAALAHHGIGVLDGLGQLQCLCLDDLERVAGELAWERGLFAVLREIDDAGGALLAAARTPPALLPWALPDLGSRFAAGAVFALRTLAEAEQHAALELRARLRGLELPEETWQWLRRRYPRDMRRLYELLDTLDTAALAAQRRLTVPFIREVLRAAARPPD